MVGNCPKNTTSLSNFSLWLHSLYKIGCIKSHILVIWGQNRKKWSKVSGALLAGLAASYSSDEPSYREGWGTIQAGADVNAAVEMAVNRQVTGEGSLEESLAEADEAARYARSLREGN